MKQVVLNIADSKFNTYLEFIKTLDYVKVEDEEQTAIKQTQTSQANARW
jgi:hypothetical protein